MILSRTPVRITLGGGGTDLPSYYSKYGGFLIGGAINKHIYIAVQRRFEGDLLLKYSNVEKVKNIDKIEHPLLRQSLTLLRFTHPVEITSFSDVPPNSGLGTSGSFTVGVLNALHSYRGDSCSPYDLAEEACKIEIEILKRAVGKQDPYMAAFGGLTCLKIKSDGEVLVNALQIAHDTIQRLQENVMLFYLCSGRQASDILTHQKEAVEKNDKVVVDRLHQIKEIGEKTKDALETGDLRRFGELLDVHWQIKKGISPLTTNPRIDKCYDVARKNGALGGKIMGAGGGGFFMFYCEEGKDQLRKVMGKLGLTEMPFKFDFESSRVLINS